MSGTLTEFELKVLNCIASTHHIPTGKGLVRWSGTARRLEKKGYCSKVNLWHLTDKGKQAISELTSELKENTIRT